jgi:hypothetical protein
VFIVCCIRTVHLDYLVRLCRAVQAISLRWLNSGCYPTVYSIISYYDTIGEVWVNPGTDKEELANGLLVMKGLAREGVFEPSGGLG